jgi:hypothetical protein
VARAPLTKAWSQKFALWGYQMSFSKRARVLLRSVGPQEVAAFDRCTFAETCRVWAHPTRLFLAVPYIPRCVAPITPLLCICSNTCSSAIVGLPSRARQSKAWALPSTFRSLTPAEPKFTRAIDFLHRSLYASRMYRACQSCA